MDFSEKWGDSIEDAVRLALVDLNLTEDDVTVTVLEQPSKGFFGIGSKLAKVRVEPKAVEKKPEPKMESKTAFKTGPKAGWKAEPGTGLKAEPEEVQPDLLKREKEASPDKKADRPEKRQDKKKQERKDRPERKEKAEKPFKEKSGSKPAPPLSLRVRPEDLQEVTDHPALTFLREVADKMGLVVSMRVFVDEENVFVDMEGKDSGTIIGKRGQTLDAIQYLTSLVVNKDSEKYIRVVIDAENYRAKRERTLEQLANRLADKVKRSGKSVRLEPMNPYERKVIHATIQNRPEVTTRSEGEEPYRRVVIEKK